MKRFKELRIKGDGGVAKRLLEVLKKNKNQFFEYNRPFRKIMP